ISRPAKTNNKKLLKYLSRHGNINTFYIICKYFSCREENMGNRLGLRYQTKRSASERRRPRTSLGPGCVGVQKILNARCPLVRFTHRPLRVPVVAMNSSEFLYLYGRLDRRVRCLVFSVQCWACLGPQYHQLYAWITNFSLTQRRTVPILLTLDHLKELADGPFIKPVCFYVLSPLSFSLPPSFNLLRSPPLFSLLALTQDREQNKPEPALNVSKHVNRTQPEHFVALSRESAWMMQQREFKVPHSSGSNGTGTGNNAPWGLAVLLMPSVSQAASKRLEILLESLKNREEKKMVNGVHKAKIM
uniref:Mitochondrial poly(A) polymerase n=1 Tax=Oncorhynchus tshawytscha TaxID=74940 RepID=A0AAZ3Q6L2_ONCTS